MEEINKSGEKLICYMRTSYWASPLEMALTSGYARSPS